MIMKKEVEEEEESKDLIDETTSIKSELFQLFKPKN